MWKYVENTTMAETTERGCASFIQHDVDDLGLVYTRGGTGRLPGRDVYIVFHLYELSVGRTMRIFCCWTPS